MPESRIGSFYELQEKYVLGLDYLGLPAASTFAMHDLKVEGVGANSHLLATLRKVEIHIQEPDLREAIETSFRNDNLTLNALKPWKLSSGCAEIYTHNGHRVVCLLYSPAQGDSRPGAGPLQHPVRYGTC